MPAWTAKEREWRRKLTAALKKSGRWKEFEEIKEDFRRAEQEKSEQTCDKIVARRAWHQAAALFTDVFDTEKFSAERTAWIKANTKRRRINGYKKARKAMAPKAKLPPMSDKEIERILEPPDDEVIIIAGNNEGDILRDTKWVYFNMARLIKTSRAGLRSLDKQVLREAPSNGAVGLAQYALDDSTKFFERFVVKILPKDETPEKQPSEEEALREVDPSFEDLAKYMRKLG